MEKPENLIRVAVICDNLALQQQIQATIESQPDMLYLDTFGLSDRLIRDLRLVYPEVILVDHKLGGESTLEVIDDLQLQFPDARIVAILPNQDPILAQQTVLAGAQAFIVQPFTQISLQNTIRRLHDLKKRHVVVQTGPEKAENISRPVKIVAIFSPRGGSGCSMVATNLALALYAETNRRVLLLEGKLFFGHLDLMLNIRAQNNLTDVLPHIASIDEALLSDVITVHASGIHVLVGPSNLQIAQSVRPDDLYRLLMGLQRLYDYVVIDVGNYLTDNTVTLLDASDQIVITTTPDLAAMRDVSRFIQTSKVLGYAPEKLLVALNRSGALGGVSAAEIKSVLRQEIHIEIPDDSPSILRSINRGVPILMRSPNHPISKAVKKLAEIILASSVNDALPGGSLLPSPAVPNQKDALISSSRFG